MWAGLAVSFAIYFVGIFVLDATVESYNYIPSTRLGEERCLRQHSQGI